MKEGLYDMTCMHIKKNVVVKQTLLTLVPMLHKKNLTSSNTRLDDFWGVNPSEIYATEANVTTLTKT